MTALQSSDLSAAESPRRWAILALGMLTNTLVAAAPGMCIPVLFVEISAELQLNLVQVGIVWGVSALPGLITGLAGGPLGDRFGPRRVLIAACFFSGAFGVLRGLSTNFISLTLSMALAGLVTPLITLNTLKTTGAWFSRRQLGFASGILSMGMALGFLLGSLLSATLLSPLLGGWRQVLFMYGGISLLFSLPWLMVRSTPSTLLSPVPAPTISYRQALAHILPIRNVWLFGLTLMGISGSIQGALGYLPLYLRSVGWAAVSADAALASFHTISLVFVIPIALLSDRLRMRKMILIVSGLMIVSGFGLISLAQGWLVWLAVGLAGMARDGFMAVFMTSIIETDGVGAAYTGTATGIAMFFASLGNILSPPIGNSLAEAAPGLPFVFWAGFAGLGLLALLLIPEKRPPLTA